MKNIIFILVWSFSTTLAFSQSSVTAKWMGHNLLKNPGGEIYTQDELSYAMPDDWTWVADDAKMRAEVEAYGHTGGEWEFECAEPCGLAPGAENHYFRFTTEHDSIPWHGEFRQSVDLSPLKDILKLRPVKYTFSIYIAGFQCEAKCDWGYIKVSFYDATAKLITARENKRFSPDFHRVDESENADSRMHLQTQLAITDVIPANAARVEVSFGAYNNCVPEDEGNCEGNYIFFDVASLIFNE